MNKQKITYALTTAAFLGSAALFPAFASDTQVAGNGAFSNTDVQTNSSNATNVNQNNTSAVTNNVQTTANTGNNSASFNTGSSVNVVTGGANTTVGIANMTGSNTAAVVGGSNGGGQNTAVAGNGAFSDNNVQTTNTNSTALNQTNTAALTNNVNVANNTGNNSANFNTGSDVNVYTGNANASVGLYNATGGNAATVVGSGNGGGQNTAVAGNGAFSNNNVSSSSNNSTSLTQSDITTLANNVFLKNSTGGNGASFNTGSTVSILSGNANAQVGITNLAGGNSATVFGAGSDGWINTYLVGNGAFSTNNVSERNSLRTALTQNNLTYVANYIDSMNTTGNNNAGFNTGSNVLVASGNANSWVSLFNTPGVNVAYLLGGNGGGNTNTQVLGNGAFSNNNVWNMMDTSTWLNQNNTSSIMNNVSSKNNTGGNKDAFGTGGLLGFLSYLMPSSSLTDSGNASTGLSVNNLASANYLAY